MNMFKIKKLKRKYKKVFGVCAFLAAVMIIKPNINLNTIQNIPSGELDEVQLIRVIDGDTIVVNNDGEEDKIRLLEIDTPESVHSDASKNNEYGKMASDYTKNLLEEGQTLYLSYDQEKEDKYGRTLAYVWLNNNVDTSDSEDIKNYMLNAILLNDGMARVTVYEPNDCYEELFTSIKENAKSSGTGLWQYDGYRDIVQE